ncbi:hypothetical protein D3C72_1866280 [compost metagenome]
MTPSRRIKRPSPNAPRKEAVAREPIGPYWRTAKPGWDLSSWARFWAPERSRSVRVRVVVGWGSEEKGGRSPRTETSGRCMISAAWASAPSKGGMTARKAQRFLMEPLF